MSSWPPIGDVALGRGPVIVAAGGQADLPALERASAAHVLELRADLFDDPAPATVVAALTRLRATGRPVLLTVRAASEGGRGGLDDAARAALYRAGLPLADAIDVEIASEALARELVPRAQAAGVVTLLSAHDFAGTPPAATLLARVDAAFALGADVAKLATHATTADDLRTLLAATLAARERGVVTLGMGPFGPLSRLLLPAAGSLLTYAAAGAPTAPGQLPVAELAALFTQLFPTS